MKLYVIHLRHATGIISGGPLGTILTVTDNAWNDGFLTAYEVGIYFEPTSELSNTNGELSFGGVDSTKINGALHTV